MNVAYTRILDGQGSTYRPTEATVHLWMAEGLRIPIMKIFLLFIIHLSLIFLHVSLDANASQ